jgi:hypothetical protein
MARREASRNRREAYLLEESNSLELELLGVVRGQHGPASYREVLPASADR